MEHMTPTLQVKPNYVAPIDDEQVLAERMMWSGVRRGLDGIAHAVDKWAKLKKSSSMARLARVLWAGADVIKGEIEG